MGLSLRAYSRHRRVTLAAIQKALKTGRITALPDRTIDPDIADRAWDAAAEVRRAARKVPADPTRVMLPGGSLSTAVATVHATLDEHGVSAGQALTLADVRLAAELLRVQQRSNAITAQEMECRLRLRKVADEAIDRRIVDALLANVVQVICQYVDPCDVPAALDKLRAKQARCVPGTVAEGDLLQEKPQSAPPTPKLCSDSDDPARDQCPIDRLSEGCGAEAADGQTPQQQSPLDESLTADAGHATGSGRDQVINAVPELANRNVAENSGLQCGTCANMAPSGWCRSRRFTVTPTLPACEFYGPISVSRFPGT
jgi:hypothetical protein